MSFSFLPIVLLFICFLTGMPAAFALIIATIPYFLLNDAVSLTVIIQKMVANTESASLMAIPFFVVAGSIMSYSGVTKRLMKLADLLVGQFTGGLGQVNVLLSVMNGGISGSGAADAATDCKILVPEMIKRGYSKSFSGAVTAASCCITPIIPPGVGLIVYAYICQVSAGRLLLSGWIPGILLCIFQMIVVYVVAKKRGFKPSREKMGSLSEIAKATIDALWALVIPFGLILGLRFGVCTATEGGAIIAVYSLIIGIFVYKEIKWKHIPEILLDAVVSTATVMLILCASSVFGFYLSFEGIPQALSNVVISISGGNKYIFLLLVNILFLFLGMFMDGTAAMIILGPLFAPIAMQIGIDPIHFGIIVVLNITLGGITPPFGMYLYLVGAAIHEKVDNIARDLLPFIFVCVIVLLLVTYVPSFSLFLPNLVYGV